MTSDRNKDFAATGESVEVRGSLSRDQQAEVDRLMESIKQGHSGLDHSWGREGGVRSGVRSGASVDPANTRTSSDAFSFSTDDRGITVNGKHYKSLDAVPLAERGRIEVLQRQFGPDSELVKQMQASGKPVSTRTRTTTRSWSTKNRSSTTTTHKTSTFGAQQAFGTDASHDSHGEASGFTTQVPSSEGSPGAVPARSGWTTLVQLILVAALVAALVLGAQYAGLR